MAINQNPLNMNFMNNMNPAAVQAYQNMFNINPNYGMNDQMKILYYKLKTKKYISIINLYLY